jgi:hypothetical protein
VTQRADLVPQDHSRIEELLLQGKTLPEILKEIAGDRLPTEDRVEPKPVNLPAISDEQRQALADLPDVYGSVVPSRVRPLTKPELAKLYAERRVVAVIENLVKSRKGIGINETIHSHLDKVAEKEGRAHPEAVTEVVGDEEVVVVPATPRDANGHYLLEGEAPVDGTGEKFSRELRGGGFEISSAALHAAYKAGKITAEQFKALTSVPVVPAPPRVFDEAKAAQAVTKDPSLLLVLAEHGTVPKPTTTAIYVRKDK